MRKLLIFLFLLLFLLCECTSAPSRRVMLSMCNEIDNAILERLQNIDVILWREGVLFQDIDFNKIVNIKSINNSIIKIGKYDPPRYSSVITFEDRNGVESELIISPRDITDSKMLGTTYSVGIGGSNNVYYKLDNDFLLSRWVLFGQYVLDPVITIFIQPTYTNQPGYGYEWRNHTSYDILDTRIPAKHNYILIYDSKLKAFHDNLLAQIADQPRRDRTSIQNLIKNLIDFGTPFKQGDIISIPRGLLAVVDLSFNNNLYTYLVIIDSNDTSLKPFYIQSNRQLSIAG